MTMKVQLITLACAASLLALPAMAQQKSAKQCNDEWRANRATIQAQGKLKRDFMAECRGNATTANRPDTAKTVTRTAPPAQQPSQASPAQRPSQASPAQRPAQAQAPQQPSQAPAPPQGRAQAQRPATVGVATAQGQHATEAAAKASCASDTVVWVNLNSKIYHFSNAKSYGNTKSGTYMCERDTARAGFRAAKNEKRP
jgi:hypothetical protein